MANRKKKQDMMRVRVVLFIIVFALMLAVIISLLDGLDLFGPKEEPSPSPVTETDRPDGIPQTPAPQISSNPVIISTPNPADTPPVPETSPDTETDVPSVPEPSAEPEPEPSPAATPEPSSEPEISGVLIGTGSFRSDTGISLNIKADWKAVSLPDGKADVTVNVSLESRMLQTIAQPLTISLGTQSVTVTAAAVDYNERELLVSPLGSKTFTIDLAQGETVTLPLSVEWQFRGTYSGEDFPTLSCGGEITLER